MNMISEKFEDMNGRKHRLYSVRSMGAGRGFGILDRSRNVFISSVPVATRKECWDFLRETDALGTP